MASGLGTLNVCVSCIIISMGTIDILGPELLRPSHHPASDAVQACAAMTCRVRLPALDMITLLRLAQIACAMSVPVSVVGSLAFRLTPESMLPGMIWYWLSSAAQLVLVIIVVIDALVSWRASRQRRQAALAAPSARTSDARAAGETSSVPLPPALSSSSIEHAPAAGPGRPEHTTSSGSTGSLGPAGQPGRVAAARCWDGTPESALFLTLVAASIGAMTAPHAMVHVKFLGATYLDCPPVAADLGLPSGGLEWPAGCVSEDCLRGLVGSVRLQLSLGWISGVTMAMNSVVIILFSQAFIALRRADDARDAAQRMHSALRYVSHETRSPLNGAVLSLALLDGIVNGASPVSAWSDAPELVGDLHASLEAAKRQLDDILTFERVTSASAARGVRWGWIRVAGSELRRLESSFAGVCRAEGIELELRGIDKAPSLSQLASWAVSGTLNRSRESASETTSSAAHTASISRLAPDIPGAETRQRSGLSANGMHRASGSGRPASAGPRAASLARLAAGAAPPAPGRRHLKPVAQAEVFTAADRLMAVIGNALSNAIKAVSSNGAGSVRLTLSLGPPSLLGKRMPPRCPEDVASSSNRGCGTPCSASCSLCPSRAARRRPSGAVRGPSGCKAAPMMQGLVDDTQFTSPRELDRSSHRRPQHRVLVIEVLDNGRGIPPDRLTEDALFRPFQQLRMGNGMLAESSSGLGLSTVRSIVVDQMGGDVSLRSREGEGTLFTARLPVWAKSCLTEQLEHAPAAHLLPADAPEQGGRSDGLGRSHREPSSGGPRGQERTAGSSTADEGRPVQQPLAGADAVSAFGALSLAASMGRGAHVGSGRLTPVCEAASLDNFASDTDGSLAVEEPPQPDMPAAGGSRTVRRGRARDAVDQQAAPERVMVSDSVASHSAVRAGRSGLVWVVDDVAVSRRAIARALRAKGVRTAEMSHGGEVVAAVQSLLLGMREAAAGAGAAASVAPSELPGPSERAAGATGGEWPDAVLVDSHMPVLSGAGAIEAVRSLGEGEASEGRETASRRVKGLVWIGATGSEGGSGGAALASAGARCVLGKPIMPGELWEALAREAGLIVMTQAPEARPRLV